MVRAKLSDPVIPTGLKVDAHFVVLRQRILHCRQLWADGVGSLFALHELCVFSFFFFLLLFLHEGVFLQNENENCVVF